MLGASQVLAVNNFGDTRSGGLAGPMGLFIIVLLGIGTVLLIRNMNARLRRLPDEFPDPDAVRREEELARLEADLARQAAPEPGLAAQEPGPAASGPAPKADEPGLKAPGPRAGTAGSDVGDVPNSAGERDVRE
jgi:hypothetical protein